MKSNASEILDMLAGDEVGFFILVELDFNAIYRYTTLPFDLTWNGNIYETETNLLSFESPRATTVVDRQTYKLRLSGLDQDIAAEIEAGIIYKPVSILMGFIRDGVAQSGINDMMHVYSGSVANVKKIVSDDDQAFAVECSAPLSSLDAKSTLFTTRDGIKNFDPTDTSFDQIYEGSAEYSLNWGKKDAAADPPAPSEDLAAFIGL